MGGGGTGTGWIAGGLIYKTTDGGVSWSLQHTPSQALSDISFADAEHGWATGYFGTLLHTTNGGTSWTSQNAGVGPQVRLLAVDAVSPSVAWIMGTEEFVARTTNGGVTWNPETVISYGNFAAAYFLDSERGWIGAYQGLFSRQSVTAANDPALVPTPTLQLQVWPNPSRTQQTFTLRGDFGLITGASVYDVTGRPLRVFDPLDFEAGKPRLIWDGRDGKGRRAPAGTYFLRVRAEDQEVSAKVLRR